MIDNYRKRMILRDLQAARERVRQQEKKVDILTGRLADAQEVLDYERKLLQDVEQASIDCPPDSPRGPLYVLYDALVALYGETTAAAIISNNRSQHLVTYRYALITALRKLDCTYSDIGRALNRDHSTILHYANSTKNPLPEQAAHTEKILQKIVELCNPPGDNPV
jgi:hypothetical protein